MTAPVRVNGQGPFAFVVDTGANQSVISAELAARLGLEPGASQALNGVAGVRDEPTTTARLGVGGRRDPEVRLSVLPAQAIGGDGMLGIDGLEGEMLTLDFKGQKLRIEPGLRRLREPYDAALKARRRDGQLTLVDADLAGLRIVAFLDSGAQNTIGNMALRDLAISRHPSSRWSESRIVSANGLEMTAEMADLPALRIGQFHLPNWPVAFADLHTFRMWGLTHEPAILLGVDVLSRFETVCLDFSRNEVRFRLPQA
jgi:predicted aspartyl protease